jgi:hypothetical protein
MGEQYHALVKPAVNETLEEWATAEESVFGKAAVENEETERNQCICGSYSVEVVKRVPLDDYLIYGTLLTLVYSMRRFLDDRALGKGRWSNQAWPIPKRDTEIRVPFFVKSLTQLPCETGLKRQVFRKGACTSLILLVTYP